MSTKKLRPIQSQDAASRSGAKPTSLAQVPPEPSAHQQRSPSLILAEQFVSAIFATAPSVRITAKTPGSIVVGYIAPGWGEAVYAVWLEIVHGWIPNPDEAESEFDFASRSPRRVRPTTFVAYGGEHGRLGSRPATEEWLKAALKGGGGLFVAVEGEEKVSPVLSAAADVELTFPIPTGAMLAAVAAHVGSGDCDPLPNALASLVRPLDLALAQRPVQTAADYTKRLERLLFIKGSPPDPKSAALPTSIWTLDTLPLSADVESWARQLVSDLKAFTANQLAWIDVDHGALLVGPPGCGKTTLAGAIAQSAGVPLFVTSYAKLEGGIDGKGRYTEILRTMRSTFAAARDNAPCILLFDEIDSVLGRGMAGHNESWFAPITNTLLTETAAEAREGVVFLGATNFPDRVDPALRRSGRLDRVVMLAPPDLEQVGHIIGAHLPSLAPADREGLAMAIIGHTGADIARLARGARRRARLAGRDVVAQDLIHELDDGAAPRQADQQRRIAIHEAGHALVTELRRPGTNRFVSIRALPSRSSALGRSSSLLPEGAFTLGAIEGYLTELLAGRAAEVLMLGEASAGAAIDLQHATLLCVAIEVSLGLGKRLSGIGIINADEVARTLVMQADVAQAVEGRLCIAHEAAMSVVTRHRGELERLTAALLAESALTGAAISALVAQPGVLH